jgi:hypothetical protein
MHPNFKGQTSSASQILSLLALSSLFLGTPHVVWAQEVGDFNTATQSRFWDFNGQTNQLRLTLAPGVAPRYFLLARPMRIAIEFPAPVEVSPESLQYDGAVEQLTVSPQGNGNLRIILQLRSGVELQPKQVSLQQIDSRHWLITPLLVGPSDSPSVPTVPTTPTVPITPLVPAGIPVGVNSILESPDLVPLTPQPLPLQSPPSIPVSAPATPQTGTLEIRSKTPSENLSEPVTSPIAPIENPWPTQIVELRPQSSTADRTPRQPVAIQPSPSPIPQALSPDVTTQTSEPEKPAPLATQPLVTQSLATQPLVKPVEPVETIAPTPNSLNPGSARTLPPSPPAQSRPRPSQVQPIPTPAAVRPPVTLSSVPLVPVPVNPRPTAIEPPSRSIDRSTDRSPVQTSSPPASRPQSSTQPITKLEFGQPLPISGSPETTLPLPATTLPLPATTIPGAIVQSVGSVTNSPSQPATANILLAKGSPIPLRYTGTVPLQIATSQHRQEVLIVDEDIKSPQGQVIIPGGSEVIGHFETNWRGSRFIAQAISLGTYNQTFEATSQRLEGDRSPNPLSIGAGSGSGAIAGTLIAGGFGALGGAAIGAVSGYFVSPQSATLEPHQILMVYLAEDWLAN